MLISLCLIIIFTVSPPTTNVQTTYENHRIQSPAQKDTKVEEPQDSKIQEGKPQEAKKIIVSNPARWGLFIVMIL